MRGEVGVVRWFGRIEIWEILIAFALSMMTATAVIKLQSLLFQGNLQISPLTQHIVIADRSTSPIRTVFRLHNAGNQDVRILAVNTGCMCEGAASANISGPMTLHPNDYRNLVITVSPEEGLSTVTKQIQVETNQRRHSLQNLTVQIQYRPAAKHLVSADSLAQKGSKHV